MATRTRRRPGIAARFAAICGRCGYLIHPGDRIVERHGAYIHTGCAPGSEDGR